MSDLSYNEVADLRVTIQTALNKLGNTVEKIEASLYQLGIKGRPRDCYHCPIASYLQSILPQFEILVSSLYIEIYIGDTEIVNIPLPIPFRQFIRHFDKK